MDRVLSPDASVEPVANLLVAFRGDTIHRVEGYRVGSEALESVVDAVNEPKQWKHYRVSVVLEQYSVPLLSYGLTTDYHLSAGSQHQKGSKGYAGG